MIEMTRIFICAKKCNKLNLEIEYIYYFSSDICSLRALFAGVFILGLGVTVDLQIQQPFLEKWLEGTRLKKR